MKRGIFVATALLLSSCSFQERTTSFQSTGRLRAYSFNENQIRYLSPLDLFLTLKRLFPVATENEQSISEGCRDLNSSENFDVVGGQSAATGDPSFPEPSDSFVRWYSKCLRQYITVSRDEGDGLKSEERARRYYGNDLVDFWIQNQRGTYSEPQVQWAGLNDQLARGIVKHHIERMVGPVEVLEQYGRFSSLDLFVDEVLLTLSTKQQSVSSATEEVIFTIGQSDEFLSY